MLHEPEARAHDRNTAMIEAVVTAVNGTHRCPLFGKIRCPLFGELSGFGVAG